MKSHRQRKPTCTSLVFDLLKAVDDFRTSAQLQNELRQDQCHVSAALSHLRNHKAVACLASDGELWWYATPDSDTRQRIHRFVPEGVTRNRKVKRRNKPKPGENLT